MRSFGLEFVSSAAPERVFALLADAPLSSDWFRPARRVRWLEGWPAGGKDAVRLVTIGPVTLRERILAEESPVLHSYSIDSVLPIRDHRADVRLSSVGAGTRIMWESRFVPVVPGTGAVVEALLRVGLRRLGHALVTAAAEDSVG
jgi:hypothetical protein